MRAARRLAGECAAPEDEPAFACPQEIRDPAATPAPTAVDAN